MKNCYLFIFILISFNSSAKLSQGQLKELILSSIYGEIYSRVASLPQKKATTKKASSINKGERGRLIIERMKEQNRAKLAKMRGIDPKLAKSGKDLVQIQKKENKEFVKQVHIAREELERLKRRSLTPKEWEEKFNSLKKEWDEKKRLYRQNIKNYQRVTIDLPLVLPVSKKEAKKKVEVEIEKEHLLVKSALAPSIKNQGRRPTCSAFSGIKAIEILAAQKGKYLDLSEQYFYWASKSKCQNRKCSDRGSWVGHGLEFSKSKKSFDIPLESQCRYVSRSIANNETQIPLRDTCSVGKVKVRSFTYLKTLDQVVSALKRNKPVIASLKLTPNFYRNNGLVTEKESLIGPKMDGHAKGHSVNFVGLVKLPEALGEGKYCFLTSNSWGQGWAMGGYSCLTEKWVIANRQINPFVSLENISL